MMFRPNAVVYPNRLAGPDLAVQSLGEGVVAQYACPAEKVEQKGGGRWFVGSLGR